ncbi:hypothetical protein BDW59DRAFT_135169 [Aspergillus cavernicola]|uniref:PHD-type domain-containing protein n=1 Tax=Aspergillus cavernicola TaxID=176166 RepID=A0ABR4HNL3_9EURO
MAADTTAPVKLSQVDGSNNSRTKDFNPYEPDSKLIPEDDPFRQRSMHYGRYKPRDDDFNPRYNDWCQYDQKAIEYWEDIVKTLWTPENSLHLQGARQAYAAGSIIIRVDQEDAVDAAAETFSCLNANELGASRKVEDTLRELGVAVPKLYFCGTVSGKNVTVESRIPGVSLDAAWRYLAAEQIELLKQQCRRLSQRLSNIHTGRGHPSYVCSGLNSHLSSEPERLERDILFNENAAHGDLSLVHNNMLLSNIIVNDDRVVGLTGWRDAGYFGFEKADKIHRQIRVPQIISDPDLQVDVDGIQTWVDLYKGLEGSAPGDGSAGEQSVPAHPVKIEPSSMNLDKVPLSDESEVKPGLPQLDGMDNLEEHPTPKKVANLKNKGNSRASSSDRSSPTTSTKAATKRAAPTGTKKGIGRKTASKKLKLDDQDNESVASHRSATPVSSRTSKTPGTKKQNSASMANSPAPDNKKSKKKKKGAKKTVIQQENGGGEEGEEEEEDSEDDGSIFCICRKPDNHTWMIGCDGECEDWFHGKCVNIDPRDADLIEKYICPNCKEKGKGWTTWKPMCRLEECRKPARYTRKNPSKYCSDEHGLEFMRQKTQHLNLSQLRAQKPMCIRKAALSGTHTPRDDDSEYDGSHVEDERDESMEDLGSRGGVLTVGDLTAVIIGVGSAEEFRKLGAHIVSPPPKEQDADAETKCIKKLGLDVGVDDPIYSPDEAGKIEKLRKQRDGLFHRRDMLAARNTFLTLVRQRSKSIVEVLKKKDPKGGWKEICGFDARLAWSDEEFDEWRLSDIGKNALQEGTPEALATSYPEAVDPDGDTAMDGVNAEDNVTSLTRAICTKKRCERHKQWLKVQQQDSAFEDRTLKEDLAKCEKEAQGVVESAVLRMWAEKGNAQNGC